MLHIEKKEMTAEGKQQPRPFGWCCVLFNWRLLQIINGTEVEEGPRNVHGSANLPRRLKLGKVPQEKNLNRLRGGKMSKVSAGAPQHYLILFRT